MGWKQPTKLASPIAIDTPAQVSESAMRACASFGLITNQSCPSLLKKDVPSDQLLDRIRSSPVVLVAGSSGAGKSCRLRGIEHALNQSGSTRVHVLDNGPPNPDQSQAIIDRLGGSLPSRVASLSCAGLAEPRLWAMPSGTLSVGERARFDLARTMHRAHRGDAVIVDEFATPLDRVNAYALAQTMRRWAHRQGIILIAATAHEDMESMLHPDLVIDMNTNTLRPACEPIDQPIRIEIGTIHDYHQLAHLHYRGAQPATHTRILRAIRTTPILGEILAGVLVVSMPTLNGSWRDRAWAGVFSSPDKVHNAKQINMLLRCISRVIVDPRSRGLGVASALVRHYLSNPQTPATEAIAAMGAVCPFFERAGMYSYELFPTPIDLRLIDALEHQERSLTELITAPIKPNSLIERELVTWSKAKRLIGAGTPDAHTLEQLAPIASCRLLANPRAYAHVYQPMSDREGDGGNESKRNTN